MMCPNRQILSVYFDGELSSPWKEKMEAHLCSCPDCASQLEKYQRSRVMLSVQTHYIEGSESAAKERVWTALAAAPPQGTPKSFWQRKIAIPLPAAAAILAILLGVLLTRLPQDSTTAIAANEAPGTNALQDASGLSNMNEVLQFLGDRDTEDIMVIRLPESRRFSSSGDPTIIKASDYSRRNQKR
ncbi:anti-sigma factor family protein [Breznakiellaceae bacterium SP9]